MISRQMRRFFPLCAALFCALCATGCLVVPVKTGTHIQNPEGKKDSLPKFAVIPGKTTRPEVEEQYKSFAVDSGVPGLFWGRFRKSTWAMFAGVGGPGGAAVGGGRMWGAFNLLVRFDSNGNVVTSEIVRDRDLVDRLQTLCREQNFPPLDLSQPATVNGSQPYLLNAPVEMRLTESRVVIRKYRPDRKVHKNWVPQPPVIASALASEVAGIKVGVSDHAGNIPVTLQFTGKTEIGKRLSLNAPPGALLTLVRWQQQVQTAKKSEDGSQKRELATK